MRVKIVTSLLILIIIFLAVIKFWNYFPPRTPIKVARIISELSISKDIKPTIFKEANTFTGEGYVYIVFQFDSIGSDNLKKHNSFSRYSKLPIEIKLPSLPDEIFSYMPADIYNQYYYPLKKDTIQEYKGRYKLDVKRNSKSFVFCLLDEKANKLYIYSYHD